MNPHDSTLPQDQITAFLEQRLPDTGESPEPDAPQVPIKSPLELTRAEEDRLVEHCLRRYDEVSRDLGRDLVIESSADARGSDLEWARSMLHQDNTRPFFGKRRIFELTYHMRVEWREWVYGGIFSESNYAVPTTRRLVQQQIARAENYFFGTEPWLSASPEGSSDLNLAQEINRYARWKARKTKIRSVMTSALEQAFIRGEGVLKTTYVDQDDFYETDAVVYTLDGEILVANDGDYIYQDDVFEAMPVIDPATGQPIVDQATGQPVLSDNFVLRRDGVTPEPPKHAKQELKRIMRSLPLKHGADLSLVHYLDFLCPRNAKSVQDADFICHVYEMASLHIAQNILASHNSPENRGVVLEALRGIQDGSADSSEVPNTGQLSHRPELAEGFTGSAGDGMDHDREEPRTQVIESWCRFDVDMDGYEEHIFAVIDANNKRPIYYDYVSNVTPDGKRPFHVVRITPVDNRWHGIGQVEVFEDTQKLIDLMTNRIVFATSQQATIKFWRPDLTLEGEANPNLELNAKNTYTPKESVGKDIDKVLTTVNIYEPRIEEMKALIEFAQQLLLNMSGVASTNDANSAGLDSTQLATGVRHIERTGQELFAPFLYEAENGLAPAIQSFLETELYHLDHEEVYTYFEGDTEMASELTPERVRDLELDIRLELTRYRNEQQDIQLSQAIQFVNQFYAQHYPIQILTAPMYRQLLKLRDIQNADEIIQPVNLLEYGIQPAGPQGTPAGGAQPPTPEAPVTPVGPNLPGRSADNL